MEELFLNQTSQLLVIKSFKHDGKLHRLWKENWRVPSHVLEQELLELDVVAIVNDHTPIQESDGTVWISKVPSVSYFLPNKWFNIVGLIEENGVRYYCNIASPPYQYGNTLTYIDYDLDVVRYPSGRMEVMDRDEYREHREKYRYSAQVVHRIEHALSALIGMMERNHLLFNQVKTREIYEYMKPRIVREVEDN